MQALSSLERHVDALQDVLEFRHTTMGPHFEKKTGLGRMGLTGFLLGAVLGLHLAGLVSCWLAPWLGVGDPFNILCALVSPKPHIPRLILHTVSAHRISPECRSTCGASTPSSSPYSTSWSSS